MYIYSLTDPTKPSRLAKADYTIRMACDPVVARDSVAYATLRATSNCGGTASALVVYNIKNISSPALINTYSLFTPYGLGTKDSALYVCEAQSGLRIYNIRNAYNPAVMRPSSDAAIAASVCRGVVGLAMLAAAWAIPVAAQQPERPSGWTDKRPIQGRHFMVAAANPLAVDAGYRILKAGGSAVDAAIATGHVDANNLFVTGGSGGGVWRHGPVQRGAEELPGREDPVDRRTDGQVRRAHG